MTPKQVFEKLGLICHRTFCDRKTITPGSVWESRLRFCVTGCTLRSQPATHPGRQPYTPHWLEQRLFEVYPG